MKRLTFLFILLIMQNGFSQLFKDSYSSPNDVFLLWQKINSLKKQYDIQQRSAQTSLVTLDSIYNTYPNYNSAYVFKYDSNGRQIKETYMHLSATGQIALGWSIDIHYNSQNLITDIDYYEWISNHWEFLSKHEFVYDNQNNLIEKTKYTYDSNQSQYNLYAKDTFQYDANNILSSYVQQFYDNSSNSLVNYYKREIFYTPTGKYQEKIDYTWDNSQWANYRRMTYQYDINTDLLETYTFLDENCSTCPNYKINYTYDSNADIVEELKYKSLNGGTTWEYFTKHTYIYDSNAAVVEIDREDYDNSVWTSAKKQIFYYDYNLTRSDLLLPFFEYEWVNDVYAVEKDFDENLFFKYKLLNIEKFSWHNNTWTSIETKEYFYSDMFLGTNSLPVEKIYVTPNPAQTYFRLSGVEKLHYPELSIYNMQAQLLYQGSAVGNIDVSGFAKGTYLYQVKAREGSRTGKLIIE